MGFGIDDSFEAISVHTGPFSENGGKTNSEKIDMKKKKKKSSHIPSLLQNTAGLTLS